MRCSKRHEPVRVTRRLNRRRHDTPELSNSARHDRADDNPSPANGGKRKRLHAKAARTSLDGGRCRRGRRRQQVRPVIVWEHLFKSFFRDPWEEGFARCVAGCRGCRDAAMQTGVVLVHDEQRGGLVHGQSDRVGYWGWLWQHRGSTGARHD